MSAGKLDTSGVFSRTQNANPQKTGARKLLLPTDAVRVRRNGIEFLTAEPLPLWTEVAVELEAPRRERSLACAGIVVSCAGTPQQGYTVSLLFLNLTGHSAAQLASLAHSQLS